MKVQTYIFSLLKKTPFNDIIKDSDNLEIIKGAGTTMSLKIGGLIFSYIFNLLFARLYGAEVMGIYALAITVAGIFSLFGQMGTDTSLVRFIAQYAGQGNYSAVKEIYKKTIQLVFLASILFSVLFYITSPWIANNIFHKHKLIVPFIITVFVLPFGALMGVNSASLRGLKKIKEAFIFSTALPPVLNTVGLMGLTYFVFKSYLTPICVNLLTAFIGASYSFMLWRKQSKELLGDRQENVAPIISRREILKVSVQMFMTSGMLLIMGWTDTLMLGIFRRSAEVGVYQVALKLALLISFTLGAINSIAAPKFSELYWTKKKDKLRTTVKFSTKLSFFISIPLLIIFVLYPKDILLLFGREFVRAYMALIILSITNFIIIIFGPVGTLLNMTGKESIYKNILMIGVVTNILMNYILIPLYGIIGASLSSLISTLLWRLIASIYFKKIYFFWPGYVPTIIKSY